jgi:hypothetical protein
VLDTLDTIIAVVIVLLLLSLIVQSIQSAIKKVLRIKSKQIEDSLIDLFENVLETQPAKKTRWYNNSPFIRSLTFAASPADNAEADVKKLYTSVMDRFGQLGRIAQGGANALESLSKEDLSKVLATVGLDELLPNASAKFKVVCATISEIRTLFDEIEAMPLTGSAQVEWAKLQSAISPLLNDVAQLFDPQKKDFHRTLVVRHVLDLRNVDITSVTTILAEVRTQVAGNAALAAKVDTVIAKVASIPRALDEAFAPLQSRINAVRTWYDTVMHSFEERYTRAMRTWAFFIGLGVAIALNANIFDIYQRLASDEVARQNVLAAAPQIIERYNEQMKVAEGEAKLKEIRKQLDAELAENAKNYKAFGFKPIWQSWPVATGFWNAVGVFVGWLLMALLLNLGAPFWHDALESLFGVKNLLKQKGEIQTSEQKSGQGATR